MKKGFQNFRRLDFFLIKKKHNFNLNFHNNNNNKMISKNRPIEKIGLLKIKSIILKQK